MGHTSSKAVRLNSHGRGLPATTSIAAAVCLALYGPHPAAADTADQTAGVLQEVTVTATRRTATIESVPYSLSVISADQISASGATDLATLTTQVPGSARMTTALDLRVPRRRLFAASTRQAAHPGALEPSSKALGHVHRQFADRRLFSVDD